MNLRNIFSGSAAGVLLVIILSPLAGHAAVEEPWNLPALSASPEAILKAAAAQPAPKDGDIEMLFEEHVYRLDDEGRQHRIARRVYRYLTEKGVDDWSCTEADWSPWCEEKPVFHVRVITPDGQVHALDPESIGEAPAEQDSPTLFSDDKLLRAPLPAIVVGAVVEEEIESREVRSLFDHGIVERFSLTQQYPVRKLRLSIEAPSALPLKYEAIGCDSKPARSEAGGRTTLVFELGPLPATPAPEPYLPAENMKLPEIVFSTGKSWADVAAVYSDLVEAHLDLDTVRPLVEKAIGKETDRDKIIELLLASLRSQIRYTGIEFGRGAIVPRSTRETLSRRYGDCKDQATLLVAMLRIAGIKAHVALLRTGRYDDIAPNLPGLGDFDHAIVYVPGGAGVSPAGSAAGTAAGSGTAAGTAAPLWIDPSARCAPAGWIPLVDQDRLALLASRETKDLVHTATMDYKDNTGDQVIEMFPSDNGRGRVRITVSCSGSYAEDLREDYASLGIKAIRKRWKDYLKEQFHSHSSPRLEYSPPLDLTKPFHVVAEATDARIGQFEESSAMLTLQPDPLFQRLPDFFRGIVTEEDDGDSDRTTASPLEERKGPLLLPEPHRRQLQYRITLPAGFTVKALPASSIKHCGPATISQRYAMRDDNVVEATFSLDTGSGRFTADQVDELRQAIAELAKDEETPWEVKIPLDNVAAAKMAAGRVAEALAHARADIERFGNRSDQHAFYSRLLLKAGLGEAARAEARKAVELEPRSAIAYANLARTLTYDLLGCHFRPGMDWAGAAEAYAKALELDPADVTTRMDWAILLEHDEDGLRYAPGTRLDDAIEEYRKAQRQLGSRNRLEALEVNLATALLYREKYADLEKLATRAGKSPSWRGFLVAAVAARQGISAADHRATEIAGGADARREILEIAAECLQKARLYPQAAALYEAAAQDAEKPEELRAKAKAIAQLRRIDESNLAQDAPRRVVQQLFAAAISGSKAADKIPALLTATASPADIAAAREAIFRAVFPALETARENQVPPLRIVDSIMQADFKVEGDAASGYRVRVSGEKLNDSQWQIVMDQGQARIAPPIAKPTIFNDMAWSAVVSDHVTPQALEEALAAVKQAKPENPVSLRTLAAVYAELGKTPDALENLRHAVQLRGERMDDGDWYVLGRIAEQYGLNDLAAGLYRKVPPKPIAGGDDAYAVAQRRLKKVQKR
jgi:tetratricopeptide (TPR) repeat protein